MPSLVREDDPEHFVEIELKHFLSCLQERRVIQLLPLVVQLLELPGDGVRLVLILAEQELHAAHGVAQPPRRIESGRQYEANAAGGQLLSVEAGGSDQRAHSDVS